MISKKNSALIFDPNFLFYKKIHKQTRILLFHLKNMKYSAALPMFLMARKLTFILKHAGFFVARSGGQRDVIFHEKIFTKFCLTCSENNLIY